MLKMQLGASTIDYSINDVFDAAKIFDTALEHQLETISALTQLDCVHLFSRNNIASLIIQNAGKKIHPCGVVGTDQTETVVQNQMCTGG